MERSDAASADRAPATPAPSEQDGRRLLRPLAGRAKGLANSLVGNRVKASIDRRVRKQVTSQVKQAVDRLQRQQRENTKQLLEGRELQARISKEVGERLAAFEAASRAAREARERAAQKADQHRLNREFTTDLYFGSRRRYDRTLDPRRFADLEQEIKTLSGVTSVGLPLQQAFRSLVDAETRGLGRIPGSTYNILAKLVLPPLLQAPGGPVLEIGAASGLFAPVLIRQFRRAGDFRSLTVVDTQLGSQAQPDDSSESEPTGSGTDREVAQHNFAVAGLAATDYRMVQGPSSDSAVQAEAGDRQYGVVVVDGDRSEEGVYADLWWVEKIVAAGGLVVLDDFGDPRWPGVERAGRRYLADGGRLQLLGTAATSAYLRSPSA